MSSISLNINDDSLAALLVIADSKNTSLTKLVDRIIDDYIQSHEDVDGGVVVNDPQLIVEEQAREARDNYKPPAQDTGGCCGGKVTRTDTDNLTPSDPDIVEADPDELKTVNSAQDLEPNSQFNRPIHKESPKGVPLYNKRITNKWI